MPDSDPTQGVGGDGRRAPMRSPVNWALLGLIIERESYAFELAQRFQAIYATTLRLSSTSHIYTALGVLEERNLVVQTPGARPGRQPKPTYRVTGTGIESYADWLVSNVSEDRRRQALFILGLAALSENPAWIDEILERCESAWRDHLNAQQLTPDRLPNGFDPNVGGTIASAETELTVAAKLDWLRKARDALAAISSPTGSD